MAGIGDGVAAVALPLLAAGATRDPLAVASVVAAQHLPWVALALVLPVLRGVDRRTLAGAGWSLSAVAVAFAGTSAVIGDVSILLLQVVALLVGTGQALDDDAQRVAGDALPGLGGSSAHGTLAAAGLLGLGLLGLPLGGVLYELLAPIPLLLDVGIFAVAALLALTLKRPLLHGAAADDGTSRIPRLRPGTARATAATALGSAASGAVAGVLVLVALDDLGLGAPAFGLLLTGLAVSSLAGGLAAPSVGRVVGARAGSVLALVGSAGALVAAWWLVDPVLPVLSVAALGVASATATAAGVLLRAQRHAAAVGLLGEGGLRAFHLVVWTATPIGALLGGVAGRSTGTDEVLLYAAATTAVAALVAWSVNARQGTAAAAAAAAPQKAP